ncbi:UDP-N-acetylmuramoyl-L-alanyl-D-glutamate--2,6-diaminopimelate ligase [Vibrio gazogenes]|uniref:UDP-N-acetylmuramoyl-L-alanyl-D-glutamate--2,6-diaminopimelate ligase n=1 Tax=Vibrio gazogenes DSM 21264 = NBRC 103151 TaxID=1123492 RepID=A0A1M4WQF8_VIBGA|nr:UDP-N-acetylmuramoyl-L-alanyl-D-glutamate--2,6-diaminopimelate ligase [Vibrio gazogenes]USP13157.1 UDP-N-acetylmuramoyl-L-alanyl-D-glutamate--2,6-diaminopimelate ligase [Vibrio gazogenes]SHE83531.1 UDP-N-acetylmuramoylalanyl-D-glutamate--2,6-diaminopimelate ligase [Vibrio gazogenes DSM 21264] [Vibrio gazogenes DSM 21264 = NBRC 103151]SJN55290.1 UDP-N-acetylmuramoyl-L-alanyl-D-glutamate--2, 6-diaminopimelate ligase [Vibrio gazogenes]
MCDSISIAELISPWLQLEATTYADIPVHRLVLDSRQVHSGDTFVAVIGHQIDGRAFIDAAVTAGANLVIAQSDSHKQHGTIESRASVPIIYLDELNAHLSELAGRLYHHPSQHHSLVGITGTNGKTTISQLIAQWVNVLGNQCAVMGTTGNGFLEQLQPVGNTTGSAIEIQETLSALVNQGANYTAMEVSSHGLVQGRVKAVYFDVGVFSNLSRDHLDYHGDMASYAQAKKLLFCTHHCQRAVINVDDPVGRSWCDELDEAIGVSLSERPQTRLGVWATDIQYREDGIHLSFDSSWGSGSFSVPLIGAFNASNVLLTFTTMLALGFDKDDLVATAGHLSPVIGRMELFQKVGRAKIVVDYAHTPDALEKALSALRVHCHGKLWAIFGCGGDRDRGKRPMMAAIAERLADHVVLTDDNPRSESAQLIIQDMLQGLQSPADIHIEHQRQKAIEYALCHADEYDIILLAGKGHEDYQVTAEGVHHYSDRETAIRLLELTA